MPTTRRPESTATTRAKAPSQAHRQHANAPRKASVAPKAGHGIVAYSGSPQQIQGKLEGLKNGRFLLVELTDESKMQENSLLKLLQQAGAVARPLSRRKPAQSRTKAENVKSPEAQMREIEAKMHAHARKAILNDKDFATASEISALAGYSSTNPSAQPNKWKSAGKIFAIQDNGVDWFPVYALEKDTFKPLKAMQEVLKVFGTNKTAMELGAWFESINGYLGGKSPKDLLATQPQSVIEAAKRDVLGVMHG